MNTNIDDLALEVKVVADCLFPDRHDATMALKLYSEIGEMIESGGAADEVADVLIMVLDYAARKGIAIEEAIRRKNDINMKRSWMFDTNGVAHHV